MSGPSHCLVLRLAGPLQSWGSQSQYSRRETDSEPTKSGVIGILAAAGGRRRGDPIVDLVDLQFGVRVDQPGTLLRDYHTVSDYRGLGLPSSAVTAKGEQKRTSYATKVTHRYYLQDAVFTAALQGDPALLAGLAEAVRNPGFPLALGRRSCVPTHPIVIEGDGHASLWQGDVEHVLHQVPWQATAAHRRRHPGRRSGQQEVTLALTLDDPVGHESRADVPVSFAHRDRQFVVRKVRHDWAAVATGFDPVEGEAEQSHDPFALLGW